MIEPKENNPDGLHQRYTITKRSGECVDPEADYFVLRLDEGGKNPNHIKACRKAIMRYADEIEEFIPKLAQDIREKYGVINRYKITLTDPGDGEEFEVTVYEKDWSAQSYLFNHVFDNVKIDMDSVKIGEKLPFGSDVVEHGVMKYVVKNIEIFYER